MADTVKVGCRHANGLRLRISDWVENPADPSGGKILREKAILDLAGSARQDVPMGRELRGYGVSEVNSDLFDTWMRFNEGDDLVQGGTIFKYDGSDEEKADNEAAERAKAVTEAREKLADAEREHAEVRADDNTSETPAPVEGGAVVTDAPAKVEPVKTEPTTFEDHAQTDTKSAVEPMPIPGPKPGEKA